MPWWESLPENILFRIIFTKNNSTIRGCKEDINNTIRQRDHPLLQNSSIDFFNLEGKTTLHYCDMASVFLDLENNQDSIERLENGLNVRLGYDQDGEMEIEVDDESYELIVRLINRLISRCHQLDKSTEDLIPISVENSLFHWDCIYNYRGMHLCWMCFLFCQSILDLDYCIIDDQIISYVISSYIINRDKELYTGQSYWDLLPYDIKKEILYWKCIAEVRDKSRLYLSDITNKNHDLILDNYWIEYQWEHNHNRIDDYGRRRYWDNCKYEHCEFNQLIETFDWDKGIPAFNLDTDLGVELYKEIFCLSETWVCTHGRNVGPEIIRHDPWLSYDISYDYRGYKVCIFCYRNALAAEKRVSEKEETRKRLGQPYVPPDDYVSKVRHDNGDYLEGEIQPSKCYCEGEKRDSFDCEKCYRDYSQYGSKLNLAICRKEIRMKRTLTRQVFVARLKYNQRNNLPLDTTIEDYRITDNLYGGVLEEYLF